MAKHKCRYYNTDKMIDVTINGRDFHCKRCGAKLSDDQVDVSLHSIIANKRDRSGNNKR